MKHYLYKCSHLNKLNSLLANNVLSPTLINNQQNAIADSGCTKHFFTNAFPFYQKAKSEQPISVTLPNNSIITSTHQAPLNIPQLSADANKAHIFPQLQSANLISIGQLCDDNCTVTFTKHNVNVTKNQQSIITGQRNHENGMWVIPLQSFQSNHSNKQHLSNGIIKYDTTKHDIIQFLHAACFSPTKRTFRDAINNNFLLSWPGLTVKAVNKYLDLFPISYIFFSMSPGIFMSLYII